VGENYLKGDQSSVLNILCQYKAIFALQERKKNRDRDSQYPKFLLRESASITLLAVDL